MLKTSFMLFQILLLTMLCSGVAQAKSNFDKKYFQQVYLKPQETFYQLQQKLRDPEVSRQQKAEMMVFLSEIAYFIDQPELILQYAEQALATGLLDPKWHTRVLINQARGYFQRKQYESFLVVAQIAVLNAEKFDFPVLKVAALVERAYANTLLEKTITVDKDLKLAAKYLNVLPDIFEKALILERFTAVHRRLENYDLAVESAKQSINIYQKLQSHHFLSIGFYNLGRVYEQKQEWQLASDHMLQSFRWALKDNNTLNQAFSLSRLSEYQLKLGLTESSEQYLKEAVIAADKSTSERVKMLVRIKMANFLCAHNKEKACENLLVETINFAQTIHFKVDEHKLIRMLAELYFKQGKFEQAYLRLKAIIDPQKD